MLESVLPVTYQYEDMAANDTDMKMEYTDQYLNTTSWKGIMKLKLKLKFQKISW